MVEKHVKIFSIRLTKLQASVQDLNKMVIEYLINKDADDFAEVPEYVKNAVQIVVIQLDWLVQSLKDDYKVDQIAETRLMIERWKYGNS